MSHSMYTHTKCGRKARMTAPGPNWHDQVPCTIYRCLCHVVAVCVCVYVRWAIYSHICSSIHLHKWHAHYWEVASCSLIPYLLLILEPLAFLGLDLRRTKDWKKSTFPFPLCNLEAGHMLCLVHTLTYVSLQVTTVLSTHPLRYPHTSMLRTLCLP